MQSKYLTFYGLKYLRLYGLIITSLIFVFNLAAFSQEPEIKKYSKEGIAFDYISGWEISEQGDANQRRIMIVNSATDAQIMLTVLSAKAGGNDQETLAKLKKQVVDPWLSQLIAGYEQASIKILRSPLTTEAAGQKIDGVRLQFMLDDQPGTAEACWLLLEQRLILLYFIRPDKQAEKANQGWDRVRKNFRLENVRGK